MTDRLYYNDSYLRDFDATVTAVEGNKIYLDRTAFYPTSGGQPFDLGTLGAAAVVDVIDEDDRIAHVIDGDAPSGSIKGAIDWTRRFDFMQQHSGQHLLSAVFTNLYGIDTLSVHFAPDYATMDVAAAALTPAQLHRIQEHTAELVFENRPIKVSYEESAEGLRKEVARAGTLRVVEITGLDRSACGGTHVRATGEIGPILIRKTEKIRNSTRLEFLCGMRAVRRAVADYDSLAGIARKLTSSVDEVPALVSDTLERAVSHEKSRKKMALELAQFQGRDLYSAAVPGADGLRRITVHEPITDDVRTRAQAFVALPQAVFVAISENPPAVLMAASKDSGVNAGDIVKNAVSTNGGRGGGSPALGQGSLPDHEALRRVESLLTT